MFAGFSKRSTRRELYLKCEGGQASHPSIHSKKSSKIFPPISYTDRKPQAGHYLRAVIGSEHFPPEFSVLSVKHHPCKTTTTIGNKQSRSQKQSRLRRLTYGYTSVRQDQT